MLNKGFVGCLNALRYERGQPSVIGCHRHQFHGSEHLKMLTLKALKENDSAVVSEIHAEGVFFERLQGMGVCPGNRVTIVRYGSPIVIEVCGGRVALAQELADLVELTASEVVEAS